MNTSEYIENWIRSFNITADEINLIQHITNKQEQDGNFIQQNADINLQKQMFDLLPFCNSNLKCNYEFCFFRPGATYIIDKLFSDNVDDDTLVLSTYSEHASVLKNLVKCKNVLKVISDNHLIYNASTLEAEIKKFKKVFIYMIALSMGDSMNASNEVNKQLMSLVKQCNVKCIFVLDAVQEMFIMPRDYSIYDYIISTSHAIAHNINFGILLSKKTMKHYMSFYDEDDIRNYIKINLFYKRNMAQMLMFHSVMYQALSKYIQTDKSLIVYNNHAPTFFTLADMKNRLCGVQEMDDAAAKPTYSEVTFRATEFLCDPEYNLKKLEKLEYMLLNA